MKLKAFAFLMLLTSMPTVALAGEPGMVGLGLMTSVLYSGLPSSGLELDVNMNKYLTFTAGMLQSKIKAGALIESAIEDADENIDVDVNKAELTRSLIVAGVRVFPWAGSFNIVATAASGTQQVKLDVSSSQTSEVIDEQLDYDLTLASFTIGNTWRWKYVYVGADWLGYSAYLGGSDKRTSKSTVDEDSPFGKGLTDFVKLSDGLAQNGGAIFLAFRLGFGF